MKGHSIQTRSGVVVDLLNPGPWCIPLAEAARALSHINRFSGHAGQYSVAQHSVHVAERVAEARWTPQVCRAALLHDLVEVVVGDVTAPVKNALKTLGLPFSGIEVKHQATVEAFYGVHIDHPAVHEADRRMGVTEAMNFFVGELKGDGWRALPYMAGDDVLRIERWPPGTAMDAFLDMARKLGIE